MLKNASEQPFCVRLDSLIHSYSNLSMLKFGERGNSYVLILLLKAIGGKYNIKVLGAYAKIGENSNDGSFVSVCLSTE